MTERKCKNCAHFGDSAAGEPGYCLWGKALPPVLKQALAAMEAEPSAQIRHTAFDGMEVSTDEDDLCSGYSEADISVDPRTAAIIARCQHLNHCAHDGKSEDAARMMALLAERDALRDQLAAARNEALEEAAALADDWKRDALQGEFLERTVARVGNRIRALKSTTPAPLDTFQSRVKPWMDACFGPEISADRLERGDRLLEEVLELLQSGDYPRERIAQLQDYVYGRPKGEPEQEVGGVMVTLAAYCLAHDLDMHDAGETELVRIWTKVEAIRSKQATKPKGSALPQVTPAPREVTVQEADWYVCPNDDTALNYLESVYGNDLRCAVSCMLDALRALAKEKGDE